MANYNFPNYYSNNPYMQNPLFNNQQNRLQSLENQFYGQNQQMQQQNNLILKGRPVTSFDEAKASMIDLDGSIFIFPDFASGKIYTKQINMDGTASIKTYELNNNPQNALQQSNINENAILNMNAAMEEKIKKMELKIGELESEVKSYVQSITSFKPIVKSERSYGDDVSNVSGESSDAKGFAND